MNWKHFLSDIIFMDIFTMNFDNPIFVKVSQFSNTNPILHTNTLTHANTYIERLHKWIHPFNIFRWLHRKLHATNGCIIMIMTSYYRMNVKKRNFTVKTMASSSIYIRFLIPYIQEKKMLQIRISNNVSHNLLDKMKKKISFSWI